VFRVCRAPGIARSSVRGCCSPGAGGHAERGGLRGVGMCSVQEVRRT